MERSGRTAGGNHIESVKLTRGEIRRLVHNWIGVDGGYLGSFSYASHDRFWLEVCDLYVNTHWFHGTTREHFEKTLFEATAKDQAAALRAILDDYPPDDEPNPDRPGFVQKTAQPVRTTQTWRQLPRRRASPLS